MTQTLLTENIETVIAQRQAQHVGVTFWNRLEGRPRAENFERALRAEVRDPLWLLTRQWQMGEFRGDDAGSPILAKVRVDTTRLRRYQAAGAPAEAFDDRTPLEARVERMPIPFDQGPQAMALDLRLVMGRYWLKLIAQLAPAARPQFTARYPVHVPDPLNAAAAPTCAHQEAWANAAAASRLMDGAKFHAHLMAVGSAADGIPALAGLEPQANLLAQRFIDWFRALIDQPVEDRTAWRPERLEYQFACSAPEASGEKVLVGEEYAQGRLDWYNFDVDTESGPLGGGSGAPVGDARQVHTLTMLPTAVTFSGMPNTRWWEFEDGRTNFGDVKPDTTDLAKLMLIEFGLVYANDWFLAPFTIPAGAIATVRGAAVTNVFGERSWIEAAGAGDDDDWQRWAMFLPSGRRQGPEPADISLVIPPVVAHVLDGPVLEEVMLARDEVANMVWGIEKTIWLPSGEPKDGREAAFETRAYFEAEAERRLGHAPAPPEPAEGAAIGYRVMQSVPEHWIPMIPVHRPNDVREVQLQRAAMPRTFEGDTQPPVPVRPRTSLLRAGIDGGAPYFVHEEEVPRAGAQVTLSFQRTRWRDGRPVVWLGIRKRPGRGEGSSGLAFDRLLDVPPRT